MPPSSRRRLIWLTALGVVVLAAAWVGWRLYQVNNDLNEAAAAASALQAAVEGGDRAGVERAIRNFRSASSAAHDHTDGPTWAVLNRAPVYGDDARGVQLVSSVLDDLARDGVQPLADVVDDLDQLLPHDGRVSVDSIERLRAPVEQGQLAFATADARLAEANPSGFVMRFRDKYRELADKVSEAADVLDGAAVAVQVMPTMLGADGPSNTLLVFQNNAEIRATGGLPGAVSLVQAHGGKVDMTRQVAASSFGETSRPVLPLTPAELKLHGQQLGTYFLDANFTPDFSRTAELMKARWEQIYPEKLDGIISMDPVALSYVLAATGPVPVGEDELTSQNVVDKLLNKVYLRYSDPKQQDAYFGVVAQAAFEQLSSGSAGSPEDLVRALARAAREHRLYVHSFDETAQRSLDGTAVAGRLVTDPDASPQVGVYLNDATGAKMSYYLRYDVDVAATTCAGDRQELSGRMTLSSQTPANVAEFPDYLTGAGVYGTTPGDQFVIVQLYGPAGGDISKVTLNSTPLNSTRSVDYDGRPVRTIAVEMKPDGTYDLGWRMTTGPGQSGDINVSVTPGVEPRSTSSVSRSACA